MLLQVRIQGALSRRRVAGFNEGVAAWHAEEVESARKERCGLGCLSKSELTARCLPSEPSQKKPPS